MWASHCPAPPQTMLWIWQLCTDKIQMLLSVALSFAKNSFEWPKKYEILLTEYFLFQKPCKCHLIDPQVSKGHTTGVLRTLPMVEPRPAFSHVVSPTCKPVWFILQHAHNMHVATCTSRMYIQDVHPGLGQDVHPGWGQDVHPGWGPRPAPLG